VKRITLLCSAVLAMTPFAAFAQSGMHGMDMKGMEHKDMEMHKGAKSSEGQPHHVTGTVKSIDAEKGTLALQHEPVASMNWPAMSMTFKAKDRKSLQGIKPGQKIEFEFVQQGKDYVITKVK